MIGLALVTVVAMLGAGLRGSTETAVKKQVTRRLRRDRQGRRRLVPGRLGRRARPAPGVKAISRRARDDQAGRRAGRARPSPASTRRRSTTSTRFDWTDGSLHGARTSRRRARDQGLRRQASRSRSAARSTVQSPNGRDAQACTVRRHPRAAADRRAARRRRRSPRTAFDGAFARPQNAFTFVDGELRRPALASGHRPLPGREAHHRGRVRQEPRRRTSTVILKMLYVLLGVLGRREPVRDGQHARARRLRAHA